MVKFLPDELLVMIFSYLECDLSLDAWRGYEQYEYDVKPVRTLVALSLTCRRFNCIAQPLLYRSNLVGAIKYPEPDQDLLARTMIESPHLALAIHAITLNQSCLTKQQCGEVILNNLDSLDYQQSWVASLKTEVLTQRDYKTKYHNKPIRSSSPIAFLLAKLPQLRLLELVCDGFSNTLAQLLSGRLGSRDAIMNIENSATVPRFSSLPHLEEVRLRAPDHTWHTSMYAYERVLQHPNLKTLRLFGISWNPGETLYSTALLPCNIQTLELKNCLIEVETLRLILLRCPNLRVLDISLGGGEMSAWNGWEVDLGEVGSVLREYGQNLVEFSFNTYNHKENPTPCKGTLGSLKEMRSLQSLGLCMYDLVDASTFFGISRSLTSLLPLSLHVLRGCWADTICPEYSDQVRRTELDEAVTCIVKSGIWVRA